MVNNKMIHKDKGNSLYFDFKRSLEATGKEAPKWPNERCKGGEGNAVDLEGVQVHRFLKDR